MNYQKINHAVLWAELVDANEELVKSSGHAGNVDTQAFKLALGMYKLYCFCERLREQYSSPWLEFSALDAARLYLINKHHWHPAQVKELNLGEIIPMLQIELVELHLTNEELQPLRESAGHYAVWPVLQLAAQPAPQ